MKLRGPYLTLVAGLVVAGIFFGLSTAAHDRAVDRAAALAKAAAVSKSTAQATTPAQPPASAAPPKTDTQPSTQPSAAATSPAAPPPGVDPGTYAGSTNGGDASVAVGVKDGQAIAYVCDGSKVEAWMQGPVAGTSFSLSGKKDATLTASYAGGTLSGTVKAAGKTFTFKIKAVKPPSGLYRSAQNVANAKIVGGWIVTPDGRQVGMLARSDGAELPAPAIDLSTSTVTVAGTVAPALPVDPTAGLGG